jgi:hypothetical protein
MIRYIFSTFGVLVYLNLFGQQECDSLQLSQTDKILFQDFWTEFKSAINNKDKPALANLCRFPFNCDYCILDSTALSDKPYIKVSKASFEKSQYKIFLNNNLVQEVNRRNMPEDLYIFQAYYNSIDKKCSFSFNYIAIEENEKHPGMQHYIDIQKINGRFKIISTWTIP